MHTLIDLVAIGLLYRTHPNGCRRKFVLLSKLWPYPVRGHGLLFVHTHQLEQMHVVQGCICHYLLHHGLGSSLATFTCQPEACMHKHSWLKLAITLLC